MSGLDGKTILDSVKDGSIEFNLVEKIAHNEVDKMRAENVFGSEAYYALADDCVRLYMDYPDVGYGDSSVLESIANRVDCALSADAMASSKFSKEMALGAAVAQVAIDHACSDIEAHDNHFADRAQAIIDTSYVGRAASRAVLSSNKFDRAGVNLDQQFPTGYVSVRDCLEAANEMTDGFVMLDDITPSDLEEIARGVATETATEFGDGKTTVMQDMAQAVTDLVAEREGREPNDQEEHGGESLDEMMSAKNEEAEFGDYGAARDNEQERE